MPRRSLLTIKYRPLDVLVAADRNPKNHDVPGIATLIERHGFIDPVLIDTRTERLLAGHGRGKALAYLKDRGPRPGRPWPPRNIRAEDDIWMVPTLETETADDAEAEHLLVGHNSIGILPGWDEPALAQLLDEMRGRPDGLEGTGYTDAMVDQLLASIVETPMPEGGTEPQIEGLSFRLIVDCASEADQAALAAELEDRGFTLRYEVT
jgi:hypothetical protein